MRWCAGRSVLRRWCSRFWLCSRTSSSKCSRCCRKRWPNAVFSTPPSAVTKRKHSERQSSWFSAEHCTRIMYVAVSGGSRDQRMWSSTCGWFINLPTSPRSCCCTTLQSVKSDFWTVFDNTCGQFVTNTFVNLYWDGCDKYAIAHRWIDCVKW